MANTYQSIVEDFEEYIGRSNSALSLWYVGVSKNAEERLEEHGVSSESSWWIYQRAPSSSVARQIETHFLEKGLDGGPGGGDVGADMVYAYLKRSFTDP